MEYCTVLYCIVLYCTVLYCTVLYCTVLYCTVLYCTVLYCTVLYCTVLYCTVLYCTVLYCTVLYCTVLYCTVLYCTVLHCTALHCTALPCPALHCTALHCIVWCSTVLCCAVLCCAALRCAALRCAALRCIALHCIVYVAHIPDTSSLLSPGLASTEQREKYKELKSASNRCQGDIDALKTITEGLRTAYDTHKSDYALGRYEALKKMVKETGCRYESVMEKRRKDPDGGVTDGAGRDRRSKHSQRAPHSLHVSACLIVLSSH